MKRCVLCAILISAGIAMASLSSFASLLQVQVTYPVITYANASSTALAYNATTELFSINATPSTVMFSSGEAARSILPTRSLSIGVVVDNSGNLVSGVPGDDLTLSGTTTRIVGDVTNTYSGVLLTGEVTAFGFFDAGMTDDYDFRFTATGGALSNFFGSGPVGVTVSSENSTFSGDFGVNFNGGAKGNIGVDNSVVVPEPSSILLLLVGGALCAAAHRCCLKTPRGSTREDA